MMLVFALLLATDYPPFDTAAATMVCETKRADPDWARIYDTNDSCVADQRANHRRFMLIARHSKAADEPSLRACTTRWSEEGRIDWSMAGHCAVDTLEGKIDFALLSRAAERVLRRRIEKCEAENREEGAVDWEYAAECAREQMSGHRDFLDFVADAPDAAARKALEACRDAATEDGVIDWDQAAECAARGGPDPGALILHGAEYSPGDAD